MPNDSQTIHVLYRRLLNLYPKGFQEQLAESMEQTFHDLYYEKQQAGKGLFAIVFWIFVETAIGIFRERLLLIHEGDAMKNVLVNLKSPALISFWLVLPFMIVEAVNRREFNEGFPIPLFIIMWLLPLIFIVILTPIVRNVRAGNSLMAHPINFLSRVVLLILIAWFWVSLLVDQWPCFMGVSNCD